jgi:hypothetical protein
MRAAFVDELTRIFSVLEIRGPSAFSFAGRLYQSGEPAYRSLAADPLITMLQTCLYAGAYSRRFTGLSVAPGAQIGTDMSAALSAANTSRERWVSDWRITQVLSSGQVAAQRYEITRLFWPGEFISNEGGGGALQAGRAISVLWKREGPEVQTGFYFTYGEAIADQMEDSALIRLYLNLRLAGAPLAVQTVSAALNRYRVPFQFKCLSHSGLYPRTDAAVLYLARRYFRICSELFVDLLPGLAGVLEADVPLFSLRLGPGLGLAEDPGNGESFGMHRCRLVAEGIADAFRKGRQQAASRLEAVEARFTAAGLDLDRPHLNPGSRGDYPWPTS